MKRKIIRWIEWKLDLLGARLTKGWTEKHYFLRHVPEQREERAKAVGFVKCVAEDGTTVWAEPTVFRGELAGLHGSDRDRIESWLLRNGIAYQIFVAKMWGAGPD